MSLRGYLNFIFNLYMSLGRVWNDCYYIIAYSNNFTVPRAGFALDGKDRPASTHIGGCWLWWSRGGERSQWRLFGVVDENIFYEFLMMVNPILNQNRTSKASWSTL